MTQYCARFQGSDRKKQCANDFIVANIKAGRDTTLTGPVHHADNLLAWALCKEAGRALALCTFVVAFMALFGSGQQVLKNPHARSSRARTWAASLTRGVCALFLFLIMRPP
ncbi:hypothetical protein ABLV49_25130 (plasmid) [Polaromonas hydrogenivorans]|uniref:Uncharacterized protein n=1 Tax=Polaromonas hydrogenivorans TaxID=335476 RepID=A0AAU7M044_9BURK